MGPRVFSLWHNDYIVYKTIMTELTICNIFSLSMCFKNEIFFSFLADANQEATKRVIEAVVADHSGSDKCPWSAAEMKGNCACSSLLLGLLTAFRS